jgi:alcohol dehydrogenase
VTPFELASPTRLVFGPGTLSRVGELARELGFRRTLLVADPGIVAAGFAARATASLEAASVVSLTFSGFDHDPTSAMADAGASVGRAAGVDSLVGLGGGSSLDCAKSIGFVLANGGRMPDYRGYGKVKHPLPPMIGVPTTAGTGSEAQAYALVSDDVTHEKMACGDPSAFFKVAILDPELLVSLPRAMTAATGYDAIAHCVETWVTTARTPASDLFAREAFRLMESSYERVLARPRTSRRAGPRCSERYWAAPRSRPRCSARPTPAPTRSPRATARRTALRSRCCCRTSCAGTAPSPARATPSCSPRPAASWPSRAAEALATRLEALAVRRRAAARAAERRVPEADLPALADEAAQQWTGRYNPRPFDVSGARELYRAAFA